MIRTFWTRNVVCLTIHSLVLRGGSERIKTYIGCAEMRLNTSLNKTAWVKVNHCWYVS
jgi:hypothetical protein